MAINNDVLQVTNFHLFLGQLCLNVYHYQIEDLTAPQILLSDIRDVLIADYVAQVLPSLSGGLVLFRVLTENLTNGTEFRDDPVNHSGLEGSDALPSSVAYAIKLNRSNKLTRSGAKRLVGVTEAAVSGNAVGLPLPNIASMEIFFGDAKIAINYDGLGNNVQITPVIVGRTLSVGGSYELDLAKINPVLTAQVQALLSTQNSRKPQ